jgi:hypothetical protein
MPGVGGAQGAMPPTEGSEADDPFARSPFASDTVLIGQPHRTGNPDSVQRRTVVVVVAAMVVVALIGIAIGLRGNKSSGPSFTSGTPIGKGFVCTTSTLVPSPLFVTWSNVNGHVAGALHVPTPAKHITFTGTQSGDSLSLRFSAGGTDHRVKGTITGDSLKIAGLGSPAVETCRLATASEWRSQVTQAARRAASNAEAAKANLANSLTASATIYKDNSSFPITTSTATAAPVSTTLSIQASLRRALSSIDFLRRTEVPSAGSNTVGVDPQNATVLILVALDRDNGCWVAALNEKRLVTPTTKVPAGTSYGWVTATDPASCTAAGAATTLAKGSGRNSWVTSFQATGTRT